MKRRIIGWAIALALLTGLTAAPGALAEEQRTHIEAHADESGATVTVETEGDFANESATVTVPPDQGVPDPDDLPVPTCFNINGNLICL